MLPLAGLAAAVPAVRAGRLPAAAAITAGQAPPAGRGAVPPAGRAALAAGDGDDRAGRPVLPAARSAVTLAALAFGLTGVVLGTSLNASIHKINQARSIGQGQLQTALPRPLVGLHSRPGRCRQVPPRSAGNSQGRSDIPSRPAIARIRQRRLAGRPTCRYDRLRRRRVVAGLEPDQRALVQRPRPGRLSTPPSRHGRRTAGDSLHADRQRHAYHRADRRRSVHPAHRRRPGPASGAAVHQLGRLSAAPRPRGHQST